MSNGGTQKVSTNSVVIGSYGLKMIGHSIREPKDYDLWYYGEKIHHPLPVDMLCKIPTVNIEYKEMPKEIVSYVQNNYNIDTFYTIKLSHAAWDVKWEKTMNDIMVIKDAGAKCDDSLYEMLFRYWEYFHGDKSKLSLKKTKDEFFTNAVKCPIDHDYLHELVAYYSQPLYQTVLKDGEDVLIDKEKFLNLSEDDRLKMIREECYVIALERFYIPLDGCIPAVVAYRRALKLVATRLTKGWFCKYLLDNYIKLCYFDKHHNFVKIFNERNKENDIESANYRRLSARDKRQA